MCDFKKKFALPARYGEPPKNGSVWAEYAELSAKYKPLDLGHGFPNFLPPKYVMEALKEVAETSDNNVLQYTGEAGHPRLINAITKLYSELVGREIKPATEILITLGAYHAIFCSLMGIIEQGDEVILMEPSYDCYGHNIKSAGGVARHIPLKLKESKNKDVQTSADFILDKEELESLFNSKTKAVIVNTPHNPTGKVFSYDELKFIADLCKKWNVICIADEVYEFLIFDSNKHIRMATLPGMWDRTLTIGSAGKVFGVTGVKLGYVYGPEYLLKNLKLVLNQCVRVGNTILQEATAICFEKELNRLGQDDSYFISLAKELELKRNFLYNSLKEAGMRPILAQGGYFIVADWSPLERIANLKAEKDEYKDFRFTKWMTKNVGVQAIPLTPFYSKNDKHLGEYLVRFCFVKTNEHLIKTSEVLKKWRSQLK